MNTYLEQFNHSILKAEKLLISNNVPGEYTTKIAKNVYTHLKKGVRDITDASVRPDVSDQTRETAKKLLPTVKKIKKSTIPALRNKFSLGISENTKKLIDFGSFLVIICFDNYFDIFNKIDNIFLRFFSKGLCSKILSGSVKYIASD
jgi:hypothetical protein